MLKELKVLTNNNRIKVTTVYPIREKQYLYVHLESDEWDFRRFGAVCIYFNKCKVMMRYIGYGNINGIPVLTLASLDEKHRSVEEIAKLAGDEIFLERCE